MDGFIAVVAHTIVVGAAKHRKCMGKKANAILAAHYASEAALRLMKPGNDVSEHKREMIVSLSSFFDSGNFIKFFIHLPLIFKV